MVRPESASGLVVLRRYWTSTVLAVCSGTAIPFLGAFRQSLLVLGHTATRCSAPPGGGLAVPATHCVAPPGGGLAVPLLLPV